MKLSPRLAVLAVALPVAALAVYAPIPEQEQGKALTFRLGASISHDSNIFGAATKEIDSMVYSVTPSLSYNGSLDDQTFLSLGYDLSYDHIVDRPGKKNLSSHTLSARLAHAFSDSSNIDVSDTYQISKNPQSLLAGLPLNTDQSFKLNQFNARYTAALNQKTTLTLKYRNMDYAYDLASLADQLDRMEHLAGVEAGFAYLPETKLVAEYRYQRVAYSASAATKDKTSHFLLAGADYNPDKQLTLTARAGFEDRNRNGAPDTTAPYVELSARYAYSEDSFFSGGYVYTLEESSDVLRFTDTRVNRFFANVQHRLSGPLTLSSSFTLEPDKLLGRAGQADIDETVLRFGLGLTWAPAPNWSVTANYDRDHVGSDDASRDQERNRYGVSARFSF